MPGIGHGLQACRGSLQDFDLTLRAGLRGPDRHAQIASRFRRGCHVFGSRSHHRQPTPGAAPITVLHRIARAIDDGLFDRVFQPLLDRTGSTPARLAPALVGAAFAAFLARILLLYGARQLAEHVFDAGMSVASAATLYRLYLRHAATPGTPNARRSSGTYMGLRLIALAGTHLQLLQVAFLESPHADMPCLALADALFVAGFYVGACEPPRPSRPPVASHTRASV